MAKISVVIPCYNQEKYISECLESILSQTLQDWEAIVIDDGSKDSSLKIIQEYEKKYPDKVKVIHQENHGVITARNNAIQQATGTYIFPLDGDDVIVPTCLEKLYEAAVQNKGDVICSQVRLFGLEDGLLDLKKPTKISMSKGNQVVVSALYKKKDWEKYGGYDSHMKEGLEDWEFWLNFMEDHKVFYRIDEPLFCYRILANSRNKNTPTRKLKKYIYSKHKKMFLYSFFSILWRFLYQKKITKSGMLIIKILKIPVYRRKK